MSLLGAGEAQAKFCTNVNVENLHGQRNRTISLFFSTLLLSYLFYISYFNALTMGF